VGRKQYKYLIVFEIHNAVANSPPTSIILGRQSHSHATTAIIMKFCAAARLLFLGACTLSRTSVAHAWSDDNDKAILRTSLQIHRARQRKNTNNTNRRINAKGGKKGNNKGGKRECNRNAIPLDTSSCPIQINTSGRYVLPHDVQCAIDVNGIEITAEDVFLDCQDHIITGERLADIDAPFGIHITPSSSDVTISNCRATKFFVGIFVAEASGSITISDSSFYENEGAGGLVVFNAATAQVAIVNSHFDRNGGIDARFGRGLEFQLIGTATIISSTASGNTGNDGAGIFALFGSKVLVWDSEISNNSLVGVRLISSTVSVVNSIVCGNINQNGFQNDLLNPSIAQGVTCDASSPSNIGANPVCQCPCPAEYSKGKSGGGMQVSTETFNTTAHTPIRPDPQV
jgi:hypothetical protein